jgi:hypothetical protein
LRRIRSRQLTSARPVPFGCAHRMPPSAFRPIGADDGLAHSRGAPGLLRRHEEKEDRMT